MFEDEKVIMEQQQKYIKHLESRVEELEQWVAGIADYHSGIPDWIQQSASSVLANNSEDKYGRLKGVFNERLDSKSDKEVADWFEDNCQPKDNKEWHNDWNQAVSSCISVVNSIRDKTAYDVASDALTTVEEELNMFLRGDG